MNALILYVLLWMWDHRTFDSITKVNEKKIRAEKAYEDKNYKNAAELYKEITYGSMFSEPAARLNLAHAYYQDGQFKNALRHYELLDRVDNKTVASIADSQIALIKVFSGDTASALTYLKKALIREPGNNLARSNYIILKASFSGWIPPEDMPKKQHTSQNQTASNLQDQAPPEIRNEAMEIEEAEKREKLLKSLKDMNMSEEQARTILDAMKSNESQYIYQLRRRQYAKKEAGNGQIEW